jgi:hypothetical protein
MPIGIGGRLFPRIAPHSAVSRSLQGRAAVEREFGRLKHDYGLAPLRVRGLARVQLHADLAILARLSSERESKQYRSPHSVTDDPTF